MPLVSPPSFFKKNLLSDVLLLLLVLLVIAHVKINAINTDSSNNNITTIPNNTNINNNTNNSSTNDSQYNSASEYNEIILFAYGITLLGILFLNRPVALTSIEFAAAVLAVAPPSRSDDGSSSTSIVSYEYLISLSTENIFFSFPASSSSSSPLPLDENNNSTTFTLSPLDQNTTTTTSIISINDDNSALVDRLQKRFGSLILVFLLTYLILLVVSFLGVSCVYFFFEKKKRKSSRSDHSSFTGDGEVQSSRNSSSDSYFSNSSSTQTLIIKYLLRRTLQVLRIPNHIMSVLVQFVVCSMCFQSGALLALDDESDFNRFAFALTLALYVVSVGAIMYVGILKLQVIEPLREDAIDADRVEVINKLAMSGCLPPLLGGKEDNEKKNREHASQEDDGTNEGENSTLQRGSSRRFHFSSQVLTDYRFGDDETTSAGAVREEEEGGDEMTVIKSEEEDVSSDHNNNNTIRRKKSSSSDSSSSSQNTNTNKNDQQIFLYWIDYHHRVVREEQKREELAAHLIAVGNKRNSVSTSSSISSLSSRSRTYRLAHKLSLAFQPFTSLRWFPNILAPRGRFYLPPPPQQRSSPRKKAASASLSPTTTSFMMLSLFDGFRPAKTLRAVRYVHFICVFFNLFLCGLSTNASGLMEGGKPQMLGTHVGSSVLLLFTVALALNIRPYRDMMTLVATTIIEGCAFFILYSPAVTKKHSSRFRYLTIETTCVIVTVMMIVALLMSIIVWLIEYRSLRRSIDESGYYNDDSGDEDEDEGDDSHYKPPKVVIVTASPFASPLDTLRGDKNDDDHNKETRRRSREGQAPRVAFFGLDNEGGENDKSNKSCSFVLRVSGDATASSGEDEHQPHDENSDFLNDSLTQNNNSTLFLSSINADEFKKHFLKEGKQQQQQQQRPSASPDDSSPTTNVGPEQHKTTKLSDMSASLRKFLFGNDNNDNNNSRKDDNTEAAATSGKTRKVWSKNRTAEEKQALFEELHQSIGLTEDDFDELLRSTTQALAELENDVADDAHDDQEKTHENEKANDDDDDQSAQLWSPYEGSIDYTRNNNNKNKLFPHRADEEEDPERNHDTFNPLLRHKDSKAQQRRRSTLATMEQLQLAQLQQKQAPTKKTKNSGSGSSCDSGSLKHHHNHDNTLWSPPVAVKKSDTRQQQHRRSASADTFASASLSQSSLLFAASATTLTMQQPAPDAFERSKTDPTFNMSSASI